MAQKYIVDGTTIKRNGKLYPEGSEITLSDEEAATLHVRLPGPQDAKPAKPAKAEGKDEK